MRHCTVTIHSIASSLQVHVDIAETELLRIVNMGNLLSPVMVALMGNSAVLHGQPAEFVSSREGAGERMDPVRFRHGMARGPFYSVSGLQLLYLSQRKSPSTFYLCALYPTVRCWTTSCTCVGSPTSCDHGHRRRCGSKRQCCRRSLLHRPSGTTWLLKATTGRHSKSMTTTYGDGAWDDLLLLLRCSHMAEQ